MNSFLKYFGLRTLLFSCAIVLGGVACNDKEAAISTENESVTSIPAPTAIGYTVLQSITHDTAAFTQGLEVYNGALLESTGLVGQSTLRKLNTTSGKIEKQQSLSNEIFAEGLTVLNDTIYQLSWQNKLVFMYDAKTFKQLGTLPWSGEGWGITNNGTELIILSLIHI